MGPVSERLYHGTLCGQFEALVVFNMMVLLAERSGRVPLSVDAFAAKTGIPFGVVELGIKRLEAPDSNSWESREDGRRIVPLKTMDGWRIVGWPRTQEFDARSCLLRLPANEWRALRSTVFERDDFTCTYCGARGGRLECDHIIPVARGGSDDMDNLTTACRSCNQSKRDKLLSEWKPCSKQH